MFYVTGKSNSRRTSPGATSTASKNYEIPASSGNGLYRPAGAKKGLDVRLERHVHIGTLSQDR